MRAVRLAAFVAGLLAFAILCSTEQNQRDMPGNQSAVDVWLRRGDIQEGHAANSTSGSSR